MTDSKKETALSFEEIRRLKKPKRRKEKSLGKIYKKVLKVQKIYKKMNDIRTDYIKKTIYEIVKTKPPYITIEDLNVKGMMKKQTSFKSCCS